MLEDLDAPLNWMSRYVYIPLDISCLLHTKQVWGVGPTLGGADLIAVFTFLVAIWKEYHNQKRNLLI
jgi:hypothetical protein